MIKRSKTKKTLAVLLAVSMLVSGGTVLTYAQEASESQLYVAVDGKDDAKGTISDPLSLEGAKKKVREIKKEGFPEGGVTVNLCGGEYVLDKTFTLGAEDSGEEGSPIVYQACPGETVTFTGGYTLNGTDFQAVTDQRILARLPEAVRGEVKTFDLKDAFGIEEFAPIPKIGSGWTVKPAALSVSVDGESQPLSRYPNEGFTKMNKVYDQGFIPRNATSGTEADWLKEKGPVFGSTELYEKYDLWKQEADIWTAGYYTWAWANDSVAIKSVELDETNKMLKLTGRHPSYYGCDGNPGTFYAYNLLCEIDSPGEWYLDRETGKLYLYPPKELTEDSEVTLALLGDTMIRTDGAEYIQFKNLDFVDGNWTGIELLRSNDMLVAGCSFTNLGNLAVSVGDANTEDPINNAGATGGYRNVITSCDIRHTGQGGVYLSGGDRYTLTPAKSKVVNCYFDDYAVTKRTYGAAVQANGMGLEVANNMITNAPHMAIGYAGNDILISNNDISNVCYETSDSGAIYTGRKWTYFGNRITNNYFHDMVSNSGIGSAAVYIDDLGVGAEVTNNLFVNVPGRIALFGGGSYNTFSNNISINSGRISFDNRGTSWGSGSFPECRAEKDALMNKDAFDETKWKETYPQLFEMDTEKQSPKYPWHCNISDNLMVGGGGLNITGDVASHEGIVENNQILEAGTDIGFTDPERLDFTVKEGDNLIRETYGEDFFKAEDVGLYGDEYRTSVGMDLEEVTLTAPEDCAADVQAFRGVTLKWENVPEAARYLIEVADNREFAGESIQTFEQKENSVQVKGLETSTTYYWRVTAFENRLNGNSSVSQVRSFTTSDTYDMSYYDGFGDANFSAWNQTGTPTQSTAQAHTGQYSYVLDEANEGITMTFDEPQKQVVSLWLYDDMGKESYDTGVAAVRHEGYNTLMGVRCHMGSKDYYAYRTDDKFVPTSVPRSQGWHELKWDYTSGTDCKMYIDDTLVHTLEGPAGFTEIWMGDCWADASGANGDISGMMFDDLRIGEPVLEPQPTGITLDVQKITLKAGGKIQEIQANLETDIDVPMELEWNSSVGEVATAHGDEVDFTKAIISSDRVGETLVTVNPKGFPEVKATCKVTVIDDKEILPTDIVLSETAHSMKSFETFQLNATVFPLNADNKTVVWTSSDPDVATVDGNGKVYSLKAGEATIIATSESNTKVKAECVITVEEDDGNLMPNSSFENGDFENWIVFPAYTSKHGVTAEVIESEEAPDGQYYAKLAMRYVEGAADSAHCYQKGIKFNIGEKGPNGAHAQKGYNIPLDPSKTYTITANIKVEDIVEPDTETLETGFYTICRGATEENKVQNVLVNLKPEDSWQEIQMVITPDDFKKMGFTATSGQVEIIIALRNLPGNMGTLLVDDVSVTTDAAKYTLIVADGYAGGSYTAGTQVPVTAAEKEGQRFVSWKAEGVELTEEQKTSNPLILTMPENDVTLTAVYEDMDIPVTKVDIEASQKEITSENNGPVTVTLDADGTFTAENILWNVAPVDKLDISYSEDKGTVTIAVKEGILEDFDITVSASVKGVESQTETIQVKLAPTVPKTYELTVVGGDGSGSYAEGAEIIVTAEKKEGKEFLYWMAEGITLADDTADTLTLKMPANAVKLTAVYEESAKPEEPADKDDNTGKEALKTGDSSTMEIWVIAAIAAVLIGGAIVVLEIRKKHRV